MFFQYGTMGKQSPTAEEENQWWAQQLESYLAPYSERLDAYLDQRVVGNLRATIQTRTELTTSELGSTICGPEHAEAGKRGCSEWCIMKAGTPKSLKRCCGNKRRTTSKNGKRGKKRRW